MASTEGDSLASHAQVLLSQLPVENSLSTDNSTNCVPGWQKFHISLLVGSSQADCYWTDNWTLANCLLHITSLNWAADSWLCLYHFGTNHIEHSFHCYSPTVPQLLHRKGCLLIACFIAKAVLACFEVCPVMGPYFTLPVFTFLPPKTVAEVANMDICPFVRCVHGLMRPEFFMLSSAFIAVLC
jgi:hypothetical protein